jgi:DNA polymerase-3 subunit delta
MFYLLHGDDEFTCREQLKKLRTQGDFGYNQDTYDGATVDLNTVIITSNTMPFLSEQRLVIVEGLPKKKRGETQATSLENTDTTTKTGKAKKGKKAGKSATATRAGFAKALAEHITSMSASTVLVLLIDEVIDAADPLLKAAEQYGKVIQSTVPKGQALEKWIVNRAKSIHVKIAPDAATLLANFSGTHLRMLANELDKLATYAGQDATITVQDVRQLSSQVQEARIFDLTDALSQRNRKQALNILHDLLSDGETAIALIGIIIAQTRRLLLVKELAQKGMRSGQIASTLGMAPFLADKSLRQVGNFSAAQLETAYRQLMATDAALKRSKMTPEIALDLLVVNFGLQ